MKKFLISIPFVFFGFLGLISNATLIFLPTGYVGYNGFFWCGVSFFSILLFIFGVKKRKFFWGKLCMIVAFLLWVFVCLLGLSTLN